MILSKQKNNIEVTIGGRKRKVKVGMYVSEFLLKMILEDVETYKNPYTRNMKIVRVALESSGDLEEGVSDIKLYGWVDEMDDEEREKMFKFIEECLGFIVTTQTQSAEESLKKMVAEEK